MEKEFKKRKIQVSFPLSGGNPFMENTVLFAYRRKITSSVINGEMSLTSKFVDDKLMEMTRFSKVYEFSISPIYKYKPYTSMLFLYILDNIKINNDIFIFDRSKYSELTGIVGRKAIDGSIVDLISAGYIARTGHVGMFWINPNMFFKGNRVKKYPKNVIVK